MHLVQAQNGQYHKTQLIIHISQFLNGSRLLTRDAKGQLKIRALYTTNWRISF